jgi:hypothetical protein
MKKHSISHGTLNVCVLVFPGAAGINSKTDDAVQARIERDMAAANEIWRKKVNGKTLGITFRLVKLILFQQKINLKGLDIRTEQMVMNNRKLGQTARLLLGLAKNFCQNADVFVFYMDGKHIGPIQKNGTRTLAITYMDYPLIIMSNGANESEFILAHELGHFLFLNNRFQNTSDPHPLKSDPAHNAKPENLMYPTGMHWPKPPQLPEITKEQIKKALESSFFTD